MGLVQLFQELMQWSVLCISMPKMPTYQPQAPTAVDNSAAEAARQQAASQAAIDLTANGRESTDQGGGRALAYQAQSDAVKKKNMGAGYDLTANA
jgi:hypothetical protein